MFVAGIFIGTRLEPAIFIRVRTSRFLSRKTIISIRYCVTSNETPFGRRCANVPKSGDGAVFGAGCIPVKMMPNPYCALGRSLAPTIGWHVSIEHSRKRSRTPFASRLYAVAPSDPRVGKKQRPCNLGYSRLSAGAADPVSETVIQCEVIILDSSPGRWF